MDFGPIGGLGHYLRVATFSPEIFLHQAEVDIDRDAYFRMKELRLYDL